LTQYDYGFRIYNPSIGKFLSVDPLTGSYPWYTPYQFAGNTPIQAIDLDGAEEYHYTRTKSKDGTTILNLIYSRDYIEDKWDPGYDGQGITGYHLFTRTKNPREKHIVWQEDVYNGYHFSIGGKAGAPYLESVEYISYECALEGKDSHFEGTQQDNEIKKQYTEGDFWFAAGYRGFKASPKSPFTRRQIAESFLIRSKVKNIERHMEAIHFKYDVTPKAYEKGTVFYKFSKIDQKDPKHYFLESENIAPGQIGKMKSMYANPKEWILEKFTLKKSIKGLESTINLDGSPGAKQIFSTEIEANSKVEVVKRFGN
jgi:hypothetical protein